MSVFSGQCSCGCTELINHITMWECPVCGNEYRAAGSDDFFGDEEDDFYDEFSFLDEDFDEYEPDEEELNFG